MTSRRLTPLMQSIAPRDLLTGDPGADIGAFRRFLSCHITEAGTMTEAAGELGIDVSTLSRWCQLLDIELHTTRTTIARTTAVLAEQSA